MMKGGVFIACVLISASAVHLGHPKKRQLGEHESASFSFSYETDCLKDCPAALRDAIENENQELFCSLDSNGCLDDCEHEGSQTPFFEAHCACDTGVLFTSYSYDFEKAGYCCGDAACKGSVLELYTEMMKGEIVDVTMDEVESQLSLGCDDFSCPTPELSFSFAELLLPISYSYSHGLGECMRECPEEVVTFVELGDQHGLCRPGLDLSCLFDCGDFPGGQEYFNAHCTCETGALFTSETFDFEASGYCCGDAACRHASVDLFLAVDPLFDLDDLDCSQVKCGGGLKPPRPPPRPRPWNYDDAGSSFSFSYSTSMVFSSPLMPLEEDAPPVKPAYSMSYSFSYIWKSMAFSTSYSIENWSFSTISASDSCFASCPSEVGELYSDQEDEDSFCAAQASSSSSFSYSTHATTTTTSSCVSEECDQGLSIQAHCTCSTGALFAPQGDFDFMGSKHYCCGSDECKDAAVALSLSEGLLGATWDAVEDQLDQACSMVDCVTPAPTLTVKPSSFPTATPSSLPSSAPSKYPTALPSFAPTADPLPHPTPLPSSSPSTHPSAAPSEVPSPAPFPVPSPHPVIPPTAVPVPSPTSLPTPAPSATKVAGVVFGGIAGASQTVSESGSLTSDFTVALESAPLSDVTLSFTSQEGNVVASPSSVTFTYLNYDTPVTVTLTGVDDSIDQVGDYHVDYVQTTVSSADLYSDCDAAKRGDGACNQAVAYNALSVSDLTVQVEDNDSAGVLVTAWPPTNTSNLTATFDNYGDALDSASYMVKLTSEPLSTVELSVGGLTSYSVASPSTVTFSPSDWDTGVVVTVECSASSSARPVCSDGTRFCTDIAVERTESVTHTVTSDDSTYSALSVSGVSVHASVVYDLTDPPVATVAIFDDLLNAIGVTFNMAVDRSSALKGEFLCVKALQGAAAAFGAGAKCSFISPTALKVTTKSGATVVPGDSIALQDRVIKSALSSASLLSMGDSFTVLAPLVPTVPAVVMSASSSAVGRCDDLVVDGSGSFGSGGRDMKYTFSAESVSGSDVSNITKVLDTANSANSGMGEYKVTIPSDAMVPGSAFKITLQANNFLGYNDDAYSDTTIRTLSKLGNPAPVISIKGDNPITTATHSSALQLQASAQLPTMTCVDASLANNKMSFKWTETTGKLGLSSAELSSTSKNPRSLNLAAGALTATETYTFKVVGYMVSEPDVNNSATVEVQVAQQDLVAVISGGSYRQVGRDNTFSLDGSGSVDPDEDTATAFAYTWTCAAGSAGDGGSCGLVGVDMASSTVDVGVGDLPIGSYLFSLVVSKGLDRVSASVSVVVDVVTGAPPAVEIDPFPNSKYNVDDEFVDVTASVTSALTIASTVWSVDSDSDVASVYSDKGATVATVDALSTLVVLSSLTPGSTYTLVLTATDSDGSSAYSTLDLVMNEPPSSGSLTVTPTSGWALETVFDFVALNWVDTDLPLQYIFGSASVNSDLTVDETSLSPFGDAADDAYVSGFLSTADSATNFTYGCFTSVVDSYGAVGTSTTTVRVEPRPKTLAELQNISEAKTQEEIDSGNSDGAKKILDATNKEISTSTRRRRRGLLASSDAESVRASVMANLEATYAITAITQADVTSLLNVLVGVVDVPAEVTDAVATSALAFLQTILTDTLSASGNVGISATAAGYVGTTLASLMDTNLMSSTSASSLTYAATMVEVMELLSACELDGALAGVGSTVSSGMVNMYSYRSTASSLLSGATSVAASSTTVSIGATLAELMAASDMVGGSDSSLLDTRVSTLNSNPFAYALDADGSSAAIASRLDQADGTSGALLLRSLVTVVELAQEGSSTPLSVSGLGTSAAVSITIPVTYSFPTSAQVIRAKCSVDGESVSLACPYTSDTHTCDFASNGGGAKYFFDYTCPSVEPKCVWYDDASSAFSSDGCSVGANWTASSVTCECTHMTAFAVTGAETAAAVDVMGTPAPTAVPSPLPTAEPTRVPSPSPTPLPTPVPTAVPVPSPTPLPTLVPTPEPSMVPTSNPTSVDTVAVAVSFALTASAAYDSADEVTFQRQVTKALFSNLDTSTIQNFAVVTSVSSRRLSASSPARELSSYDWAVSFTVTTSLSAVGYASSPNEFATKVNTRLSSTASGDFLDTLTSNIPAVTSTSVSPTATFESRTPDPTPVPVPSPTSLPTPQPTPQPTLLPTPQPSFLPSPEPTASPVVAPVTATSSSGGSKKKKESDIEAASSNLAILLPIVIGLALLCAVGGYKAWQMSQNDKLAVFMRRASEGGGDDDDDADLGNLEDGASFSGIEGQNRERVNSAFESGQDPNPLYDAGGSISSKSGATRRGTSTERRSDLSSLERLAAASSSESASEDGSRLSSRVPSTGAASLSDGLADSTVEEQQEVVRQLVEDASLTVPEKLTRLAAAKEDGSFTGDVKYAAAKRKIMVSSSKNQAVSYAELTGTLGGEADQEPAPLPAAAAAAAAPSSAEEEPVGEELADDQEPEGMDVLTRRLDDAGGLGAAALVTQAEVESAAADPPSVEEPAEEAPARHLHKGMSTRMHADL